MGEYLQEQYRNSQRELNDKILKERQKLKTVKPSKEFTNWLFEGTLIPTKFNYNTKKGTNNE